MQRASESIGALAAALARAQTLLTNPEKRARSDVSLCAAFQRASHRAQSVGPARNCHRADYVD
jgi:hypothetical protein